MTTIQDPEQLLRTLGAQPPDDHALAAARTAVEKMIGSPATAEGRLDRRLLPRRGPVRPALALAAASVAALATTIGLVWNPADTSDPASVGAIVAAGTDVAAGPDGFVVPSATATADCTPFSHDVPREQAVAGGVGYLLTDAPSPTWLTARVDDFCTSPAIIAASLVQIAEDQTLSAAVTLWGPDAVSPIEHIPGATSSSDLDLGGGLTAIATSYEAPSDETFAFDGVTVISWTAPDGDWVLTTSGLDPALVEPLSTTAAHNGADSLPQALPGFTDMTPQAADAPVGLQWLVGYGNTDVVDPACVTDCIPTTVDQMPDHMTLKVGTDRLPWSVRASTRTLANPYDDTTAVYEVVDVNGVPGLFSTAGERGLEGRVEWTVAPGINAELRGTWGETIDGVLPYASTLEPVTAEDPRIPPPPVDDGT